MFSTFFVDPFIILFLGGLYAVLKRRFIEGAITSIVFSILVFAVAKINPDWYFSYFLDGKSVKTPIFLIIPIIYLMIYYAGFFATEKAPHRIKKILLGTFISLVFISAGITFERISVFTTYENFTTGDRTPITSTTGGKIIFALGTLFTIYLLLQLLRRNRKTTL